MDSRVLPGAAAYHGRHSVGQRSLIPRGAQDLRLGVPRSSFTLAALVQVHGRGIRYADRAGRNLPRGVRGAVSLGEPGAARRASARGAEAAGARFLPDGPCPAAQVSSSTTGKQEEETCTPVKKALASRFPGLQSAGFSCAAGFSPFTYCPNHAK